MNLSKKTVIEFRELLASWTLRQIDNVFQSEDISLIESYTPNPRNGQRFNRVEQYLQSLDLTNQDHVAKLLRAIEHVLVQKTIENNGSPLDLSLLHWLKRDGIQFLDGRLMPLEATSTTSTSVPSPAQTRVPDPPPAVNTARADSPRPPTAFISYSWDNEPHQAWVMEFATRLRQDGIDAKLDRWELNFGADVPHFMETAVRTNDFILIILTPNYRKKSNNREGGVGYEGHIMTAELFAGAKPTKFIPVLREGSWDESSPSWLRGKLGVDLRQGHTHYEEQFHDLTATLHGMQKKAPPLGPSPKGRKPGPTKPAAVTPVAPVAKSEPIRILHIIASEVGTPRNDGTRGSALYAVPFQLSRTPSREWAEHFIKTWDRPPSFSTMHRPGIARVIGDRIILNGTTVEEVAEVHRDTLKGVLDKVNHDIADYEEQQHRIAEQEEEMLRRHKQATEDAARKLSFD